MKITVLVQGESGEITDITEGVRVMYDAVLGSLDWQSGFLDLEELEALGQVADACGFGQIEEVYQRIQAEKASQEARAIADRTYSGRPARTLTAEEREEQHAAYRAIIDEVQRAQAAALQAQIDQTTFQALKRDRPIPPGFRYFKETPS